MRTVAGDYVEGQLAERMDRPKLIGDIVTHWHKYGERRKTVCFAVNVAHSIHLRDEFINSGVRAEHIDGIDAQSPNAMQRWRAWHPARSSSSPTAWC